MPPRLCKQELAFLQEIEMHIMNLRTSIWRARDTDLNINGLKVIFEKTMEDHKRYIERIEQMAKDDLAEEDKFNRWHETARVVEMAGMTIAGNAKKLRLAMEEGKPQDIREWAKWTTKSLFDERPGWQQTLEEMMKAP